WYGVEGIKRREDAEHFAAMNRNTVLALLDEIERLRREQEEIADNVTRFALYDPDLNAWECQADDCRFWWEFEDGNPYDHDMRFCPRCGRRTVRGRNKSTVITLKQRDRHETHLQALQGWAPPRKGNKTGGESAASCGACKWLEHAFREDGRDDR